MDKLIEINDLRFSSNREVLLNIPRFQMEGGRAAGFLGANGSGKSLLAGILAGRIPGSGRERRYGQELSGELRISGKVELVSFLEQSLVMSREHYYDDTEFLNAEDPGRLMKAFICGAPAGSSSIGAREFVISDDLSREAERLMSMFGLMGKGDRGLRYLSTGEFRKALLCRSLLRGPDLLILDDPFSGLDAEAVEELKTILKNLRNELALLILSGKLVDIPPWCDSLSILQEGESTVFPSFSEGEAFWNRLMAEEAGHLAMPVPAASPETASASPVLIRMRNVAVSYQETRILSGIDWTVRQGEHWQIAGPNGSGKSTLLSLISGDNPKAFGQDITLFGRKKGSGETVWEIKQKIGFVSGAFHLGYLKKQSILEVILSGYFDSVGLYEQPDPVQIETAKGWCEQMDLADRMKAPFGSLSFGHQRSVLIARAVIKEPPLLILDEPCHGLDDAHTVQVLKTAEYIASRRISTLLYVSHRAEQRIPSLIGRLLLRPHPEGGFTGEVSSF